MDKQEETLMGICPSCGKPLKMEQTGGGKEGEELRHCEEICSNPAAVPTGVRLMPDQATLRYVDGDMHEYTREEYIKNHGVDPDPIWKAIEKWREEQAEKQKMRA
jgi:hypothetical protein